MEGAPGDGDGDGSGGVGPSWMEKGSPAGWMGDMLAGQKFLSLKMLLGLSGQRCSEMVSSSAGYLAGQFCCKMVAVLRELTLQFCASGLWGLGWMDGVGSLYWAGGEEGAL